MDPNEQSSARRSHSSRKVDEGLVRAVADPAAHRIPRNSHDAHHLVTLQAGCSPLTWNQTQGPAQSVLVRPKLLCRGLTDDHDRHPGVRLLIRKITAPHDGDLEYPEIFGRDAVVGGAKNKAAICWRYGNSRESTVHWSVPGRGNNLDGGIGREPIEYSRSGLLLDCYLDNVPRPKTDIQTLYPVGSPEQDAGSDQQQHANGDLSDDK